MLRTFRRETALLLFVSLLVFGWQIGRIGLIDPDEPFYAQSAREMLRTGDWTAPRIFDQPQFEKPILFFWLAAGSFRLLGENEGAARAVPALFAVLLVLLTGTFGARAFGRRAGLFAGLTLASCVALAGTARLMLTDVVFAFFLTSSAFALWRAFEDDDDAGRWLVTAAVASALAVLTKGPLGLLIPALAAAVAARVTGRPLRASRGALLAAALLFTVIAAPWYLVMIERFGLRYVQAFFVHENLERLVRAEHRANNRLDYYPAFLLVGSIPWLPLLGATLLRVRRDWRANGLPRFLWGWILVCLAFFTLAQSKLPTYILFLFAPLALLMGRTADALLAGGFAGRGERALARALAVTQALGFLAVLALPTYAAARIPALAAATCLAAAAAVLWRRPSPAWMATSALATIALIGTATTVAGPGIDALLSVRRAARAAERAEPEGPLLSSAFLVRGVHWYTGRVPWVISDRDQPFFTPHPVPVVRGLAMLGPFVAANGPVLCLTRDKEWHDLERNARSPVRGDSLAIGDKVLMRVPARGTPLLP